MQVYTNIGEIHEKISLFHLWDRNNARYITQMRDAVRLLKRYQIIDIFDNGQDLEGDSMVVIYPTVHLLLQGENVREILLKYAEDASEKEAADDRQ